MPAWGYVSASRRKKCVSELWTARAVLQWMDLQKLTAQVPWALQPGNMLLWVATKERFLQEPTSWLLLPRLQALQQRALTKTLSQLLLNSVSSDPSYLPLGWESTGLNWFLLLHGQQ
jgi:hypothetical protein